MHNRELTLVVLLYYSKCFDKISRRKLVLLNPVYEHLFFRIDFLTEVPNSSPQTMKITEFISFCLFFRHSKDAVQIIIVFMFHFVMPYNIMRTLQTISTSILLLVMFATFVWQMWSSFIFHAGLCPLLSCSKNISAVNPWQSKHPTTSGRLLLLVFVLFLFPTIGVFLPNVLINRYITVDVIVRFMGITNFVTSARRFFILIFVPWAIIVDNILLIGMIFICITYNLPVPVNI